MKSKSTVKQAKIINIVAGVLVCAVGVAFLINTQFSFSTERIVIGVIAVLIGIAKLFGYFSNDMYRLAFQFDLAVGVFVIIMSVMAFIGFDKNEPKYYIFGIGIYIILDGMMKTQTAVDAKHFGIRNWGYMMFSGIAVVVLGIITVISPHVEVISASAALGIALCADGALNAWVTAFTVKVRSKKKHIDNIEEK